MNKQSVVWQQLKVTEVLVLWCEYHQAIHECPQASPMGFVATVGEQ